MEYEYIIRVFISIFMCLIINIQPASPISTHHVRAISSSDYSSTNGQIPPEKIRWEIGLREATFQALRRERINQPHLKDEIYSAPILGYQDAATPFGDIAVLARGQLYSTPLGYKFVQDVYRNDCDDCHNKPFRCENQQCSPYHDNNSKSLTALWTVKRIRHRDSKSGHRYELQFTVSPMSPAANAEFVTRNGNFDYNIPGHVFIIKVKNPVHGSHSHSSRNNYDRSEKYKSDVSNSKIQAPYWPPYPISGDTFNGPTHTNLNEFTPNSVNFNTGEFYTPSIKNKRPDLDPNHAAYLIGIANDYKSSTQEVTHSAHRPYTNKQFFKTHERIQKEPIKHYHHHFYIPEVSDIDLDRKNEHPPQLTTKNAHQYITSIKPVLTSDSGEKYYLTTNGVPNRQLITQPTQRIPPLTTDQGYTFRTTYKYQDTTLPIPLQPIIFRPSTKYHPIPTYSTIPNNPQTIYKIINVPSVTQPTPFNPSPFYIRYSDPDPTYSNNEPPTVAGYITQSLHPTAEPKRTTYISHTSPQSSTIFTDTEIPTTLSSIKSTKHRYPDSINAQLPPPKSGADTTIPYVSSTMVAIVPKPVPTQIKQSESETSLSKVQVNRPVNEDRETTTIELNKDEYSTTHKDDGHTELIPTTPVTNIMKPTYVTRTTESTTTPVHITTALTAIMNDMPTTENLSTATKRYYGRPYKYKQSYIDDLDIFANNKTATTTKEHTAYDTTMKEHTTYDTTTEDTAVTRDEIFTTNNLENYTTSPTTSTTDVTLKNTRISKYLKYNRNRTSNFNKYNRNYNSKRLRARNFTRPEKNDDVETKTSQSLITSISFKVNKNNKRNYTDFSRPAIIPTNTDKPLRTKIYQINSNQKEFNVFKAELPESTMSTQNTQAFDDIAQTLVNHARIVTYLDTKTTTPSNTHK